MNEHICIPWLSHVLMKAIIPSDFVNKGGISSRKFWKLHNQPIKNTAFQYCQCIQNRAHSTVLYLVETLFRSIGS